jgi:glyoxylase-like metal-dependent hydrolase (beta-lactamase superfamily II)
MTLERSYFEVYTVRYATREARSGEHFYGHDPHDVPMPMDYFIWAAVSEEHTVVIDAGFNAEVAVRRGRDHLRCPTEGLRGLGIDSEEVPLLILTHLHYDHVGNLEKFPAATFVVQEEEMRFWTGRYAGKPHFRGIIEPEDVLYLVRENFAGRLRLVAGSEEVVVGSRGASDRRPFPWDADRQDQDAPGQRGPRLRRHALLRKYRAGPPV